MMKTLMAKLKVRALSYKKGHHVSYSLLFKANDWGAMSRKNICLLLGWTM